MVPMKSNAERIGGHDVRAGVERAAAPPHLDGANDAAADPRVVTTGGKVEALRADMPCHFPKGIDEDTGEPVHVYAVGPCHVKVVRHLTPDSQASSGIAQIDALAFTIVPPDDESMRWVTHQLQPFMPIDNLRGRNGCFGFKQSVRFGDGAGLIAWGGKSQRDRVYVSIQGKGCSLIQDWAALADWLQAHRATLKRVDVAHDDFKGEAVSIARAIEQYRSGGFNAGGRQPRHGVHGDWLAGESSIKGRTLGIGSRTSGKYCRIYEKGKQLGDPASPWTRVEVEWRGKDRLIPFDILTAPGKYLAGAYPCLGFLSAEQSRIKTVANGAFIAFESAVGNGKQQAGKLVNLMLRVFGGDMGEVVKQLQRDGIPARIDPYSYHLAESPELLDPATPGSFASMRAPD